MSEAPTIKQPLQVNRKQNEKIKQLESALGESVKLQSHYAKLLNMYDGGQRMGFDSIESWMNRLDQVKDNL